MQPTLRVLGLVLVPLVVSILGLRLMDWTTGWREMPAILAEVEISPERYERCLERFGPEVDVEPGRQQDPQTTWAYDIGDVCAFVAALEASDTRLERRPGGSARYMQFLKFDRYFPLVYGLPLMAALLLLARDRLKAKLFFSWLPTWPLVGLFPLIMMVADHVEYRALLDLVGGLVGGVGRGVVLDPDLLPRADSATQIKIFAGGVSALALLLLGVTAPAILKQARYEWGSLQQTPLSSLGDLLGWLVTSALQATAAAYVLLLAVRWSPHGPVIEHLGFGELARRFDVISGVIAWQLGYFGFLCGLGLVVGLFLYFARFPLIPSVVSCIAVFLLLFGFNPVVLSWFQAPSQLTAVVWFELLILGLFVLSRLRYVKPGRSTREAPVRDIVICIDGTWNHPDQPGGPTNVFRLWRQLDGDVIEGSRKNSADRTKRASRFGDVGEQVARYYRGLGNAVDHPFFDRVLGGAFGFGAERLRDRVYTDIVYNHRPGDRIHIVGFSRGAAIARLVASRVAREAIPDRMLTFRCFGALYTIWSRCPKEAEPTGITTLGLFDTVTRIGVSSAFGGRLREVQLGDDLRIDPKVEKVVHMVSLDEQRDAFVPTLVAPDAGRVEEVWFAGGHSDVGGGYVDGDLATITYAYLRRRLTTLRFDSRCSQPATDRAHMGARHQETGMLYEMITRQPPAHATIHRSVWKRIAADETYRPRALRLWNIELVREEIRRERWEKLVTSHGELSGDAPSDQVDAAVELEDDSGPAEPPEGDTIV